MTSLQSPLSKLDGYTWASGSHHPDHTVCIMEAAAVLAGEKWTDHPVCVDEALAAYSRVLWDDGTPWIREQMKERLLRMMGTAGDGKTQRRLYIAADYAVRKFAKIECALATARAQPMPDVCARDTRFRLPRRTWRICCACGKYRR